MPLESKTHPTTSEPLIAQVRNQNGAIVGVAFAVGKNHILTCAHVVNKALANRQDPTAKPNLKETVTLIFPFTDRENRIQARIIDWVAPSDKTKDSIEDLALLEIDQKIGGSKLTQFASASHNSLAYTLGYSEESGGLQALRTDVRIKGKVDHRWDQIEGISGQGTRVDGGFSGSPLWNESGEVVGMVVAANHYQPEHKIAYMIPARTLEKFVRPTVRNRVPRYWRSIAPKIFLRSLIQPIILKPLIGGLVGTIFILGIRSLGVLEAKELEMYDRLLASRPQNEEQDPRILIVAITEEDLKKFHENQQVSDGLILNILKKISAAQPKVMGLDVIRDRPAEKKELKIYQELATFLSQNSSQIVASCKIRDDISKDDPKYKLPIGFNENMAGFINLSGDQDNIIRRQILGMVDDDTCPTDYSLSLRLATRYFGEPQARDFKDSDLPLNDLPIGIPVNSTRPYQALQKQGELGGYQMMINYRAAKQVADQVSVHELLDDKVDPSRIQNKIILIGYTAGSAGDRFTTPLTGSTEDLGQMDGVVLHAHMVSQLVSAVKDGRPLIWLLPLWAEWLYLLVWGILGSIVSLRVRCRTLLCTFLMGTLGVFGWAAFTQALWLPSVPAFLTFASGAICVFGYNKIKQLDVSIKDE